MRATIITILIPAVFIVSVLSGCFSFPTGHYECTKKIVDIKTECKGVIGCNYIYKLEDGSSHVEDGNPAKQENGILCEWKRD